MVPGEALPRVLIMDDEPDVLRVLQLVFEEKPWHVEVVTCGAAAILQHEKHAYDLILVDKNLPDMDGIDVIRHIRASDSRVRFIVITGFASLESAVETANLDVDGYLEKPFRDVFAVAEAVETALAPMLEQARGRFAREYVIAATGPLPAADGAPDSLGTSSLLVAVLGASRAETQLARGALAADGDQLAFYETFRALMAGGQPPPSAIVLCAGCNPPAVIPVLRETWPDAAIVVVSENLDLRAAKRLVCLKVTAVVADSIDSYASRRIFSRLIPTLRQLHRAKKTA